MKRKTFTQDHFTDIAMKALDHHPQKRPTIQVFHVSRMEQRQAWRGLAYSNNKIKMWFNGMSRGREVEASGKSATCFNHYEIRLYLTHHEIRHFLPDNTEDNAVQAGCDALKKHRKNWIRFVRAFRWKIVD